MTNNKSTNDLGYNKGTNWNADRERNGSSDDTKNAWDQGQMVGDDQSASPADSNQTKKNWDRGVFADGEEPRIEGGSPEISEEANPNYQGPGTAKYIREQKLKEKAAKAAAGKAEKGAATKVVGFFAGSGKFKLLAALLFVIIGTILLVLFASLYTEDACATPTSGLISEDQLTKASSTFPGTAGVNSPYSGSEYQMPEDTGGFYGWRQGNITDANGTKNYQNQFGKLETIQATYSIAKKWNSLHSDQKLLIGDINAYKEVHDTHDKGIDVDVFSAEKVFMDKADGDSTKRNNDNADNPDYDKNLAIELGKIAMDTEAIHLIYYKDPAVIKAVNDYAESKGYSARMVSYDDHENHFHLRFKSGVTPVDVASGALSDSSATCTGTGTGSRPTIICVDPGHKSEKDGAPGEREMNWEMANLLIPALEAKGYKVFKTREDLGETVFQAERIKRCVAQKGDFWFSLHGDNSGSGDAANQMPYLLYPNNTENPKTSAKGLEMAEKIHEKMKAKYSTAKKPCPSGTAGTPGICSEAGKAFVEAEITGLQGLFMEMTHMHGGNWPTDGKNFHPPLGTPAQKKEMVDTIVEGIMNAIPPTQSGGGSIVQIAANEVDKSWESPNNTLRYKDTNKITPYSQGVAYCALFVTWVYKESGSSMFPSLNASSTNVKDVFKNKGWYHMFSEGNNDPQPGDIVWRSRSGGGHIGIVEKVENGKLHTIEGNSQQEPPPKNSEVHRKEYILGSGWEGYGREGGF